MQFVEAAGLKIAKTLHDFVAYEAVLGLDISADEFWTGLGKIVEDFGWRNRKLLQSRDRLQTEIDEFYRSCAAPAKPIPIAPILPRRKTIRRRTRVPWEASLASESSGSPI